MPSRDDPRIGSQDDLKEWLRGKTPDLGQAIATRCALRVAPLVFIAFDPENQGSQQLGKRAVLAVFRALFVSWSFLRHSDPQPGAAQPPIEQSSRKFAAAAAARSIYDEAKETAKDGESLAGTISNLALCAAYAAGSNSWVSDIVADVVDRAAVAAKSATKILSVRQPDASTAETDIWRAVAADAKWLLDHPKLRLIEQPLWLIEVRGDSKYKVNFPPWIRSPFDAFARSRQVKETPWEIWVAWYRALLPVQPHAMRRLISGPQTDLMLSSQGDNFWEREPDNVVGDISVLLKTGNLPARPEVKRSSKVSKEDEQLPAGNTQLHFLSDGVHPEVDYLGRTNTVFVLAMRLNMIWDQMVKQASDDGRSPASPSPGFVVHIDSPWGGGKTTFMDHVARVLSPWRHAGRIPQWMKQLSLKDPKHWPERHRRPWIIVNFNAWRHQHVDPPWWVLYQAILSEGVNAIQHEKNTLDTATVPEPTELYRYPGWCRRWLLIIRHWATENWWRIWTPAFRIKVFITLIAINAILYVHLLFPGSLTALAKMVIAGIPILWTAFTAIHSTLITGTPDAAKNYSLGSGDPFDSFRNHFSKMLCRLKRPVLVVIDDLDRCNPTYIVELVRGLQTLFLSPRIIFAILGDRNWIERAFSQSFREMNGINVGPEHSFGARFVEKAVQFSFVLPAISEDIRHSYVRHLLNGQVTPLETRSEMESREEAPSPALRRLIQTSSRVLEEPDYELREMKAGALISDENYFQLSQTERERFERELGIELSLRAAADESSEMATRHRIEPLAPLLPANPRQIKRIVNMISFLQEIARLEAQVVPGSGKWEILARWVVLIAEWPKTWFTLSTYPLLANKVLEIRSEDSGPNAHHLTEQDTKKLAEMIRNKPRVMALLRFESEGTGWDNTVIDTKQVSWLRKLIPPVSGELLNTSDILDE